MKTYLLTLVLVFGAVSLFAQHPFHKTSTKHPYSTTFLVGIPVNSHEGMRESSLDVSGDFRLVDDYSSARLLLKTNKMNTGYVKANLYDRKARLLNSKTLVNVSKGARIDFDYFYLPAGTYTILVKTDHGKVFWKKIQKSHRQMWLPPTPSISLAHQK